MAATATYSRQLGYPSRKAVLRNFSIEKRRSLVKGIPSIRTLNTILPYNFRNVEFRNAPNAVIAQLDTLIWMFVIDNDGFVLWILTPEGRLQLNVPPTSSTSPTIALHIFYLRRPLTRVANFLIDNISIISHVSNCISRIDSAKIFCDIGLIHNVKLFNKSSIGTLTIQTKDMLTDWPEAVENLECDTVKLFTLYTPSNSYENFNFKKLEIKEAWATEEKFRNMCSKFKSGQFERDSYYLAIFRGDIKSAWKRLEDEFSEDKMSFETFFTFKACTPDCEIIVDRLDFPYDQIIGDHSRLRIRVVPSGFWMSHLLFNNGLFDIFFGEFQSFRQIYNLNPLVFFNLIFLILLARASSRMALSYPSFFHPNAIFFCFFTIFLKSLVMITITIYPSLHSRWDSDQESERFKSNSKALFYGLSFSPIHILAILDYFEI